MNKKMLDALTSAIYVSKLSLAGEAVTEDDQKIRAAGLYPDCLLYTSDAADD